MTPIYHDGGRESISARIARDVMGWTDNWDSPGGSREPFMWGIMDWYSPTEPARAANFPNYSDDITAAFELVDVLNGRGWSATLRAPRRETLSYWPHEYSCELMSYAKAHTTMDGYAVPIKMSAATLPLAICLAALKTVSPTPETTE